MIHKIQRLISVGKFRNYIASGDVAFKKLTMIYAKNGIGKTTLACVIRSLASLKPELVRNRQSTNSTGEVAAQIIQRVPPTTDTSHNLGTNGWSNPFPDIEIFDIHFVNENVYSGFEFSKEHKEELYNFVLGQQAVILQEQIDTNKEAKAVSVSFQASITEEIIQQVGNGLTEQNLPNFLQIDPTTEINITQQISDGEGALLSAQSQATLQTLPQLSNIQAFSANIDFTLLITDLARNSQTIQNQALQTLYDLHRQDLQDNDIEEPEYWINKGNDFLLAKTAAAENPQQVELHCPFCKQPVSSTLDIINAYTLHFNEEFNSYVQHLTTYRDALQNINLDTFILNLNNSHQANIERTATWSAHLPATAQAPVFNIIADEHVFRAEMQALLAIVNSKLQNPSVGVATISATTFQSSIASINQNITTYNGSVTAYNGAITAFRATIQTVATAESNLQSLRRIQSRCLPAIDNLCSPTKK
ncbi:MAG: AAA family ATPase [Bacteroidetes bacterium]|nr:AAA family ATPase [Bacteroidota bacterium]